MERFEIPACDITTDFLTELIESVVNNTVNPANYK